MPSNRVGQLRPTAVNSVLAEVRALQARGVTPVSLMRGEPDLPTPPHIVEAAAEALRRGRTQYPDNRGELKLREAAALKLHRDNGISYDPGTEILVTTGATMGIWAALTALLNEGDEVLVPEPVYDAYYSPILLAGAVPRGVPAILEKGRFTIDASAWRSAVTSKSRALLINTPWNPVGTVLTRAELTALAGLAAAHNLTILSDEIYETITYDGHTHISPASLGPEIRNRTILINSLSKTYAMTGWRVGYCAAPAETIGAMLLVLQQASRGPATFLQDAAAAALTGPQDCVAQMREEYARRRARALVALTGMKRAAPLAPEGGFFAMLDVRGLGLPSNDIRRRLLNDHHVTVIHGAAYGAAGEGTLRVSFATGANTLAEGLRRLRTGLEAVV
jgi:aspartate/methionine/tyrosine aminotransferase